MPYTTNTIDSRQWWSQRMTYIGGEFRSESGIVLREDTPLFKEICELNPRKTIRNVRLGSDGRVTYDTTADNGEMIHVTAPLMAARVSPSVACEVCNDTETDCPFCGGQGDET